MVKHTPGPWYREWRYVWVGDHALQAPTNADAALIQAAPKLLAQLQRIVNNHGVRAALLREGYADVVDEARAVITSVTGEQQ